MWILKFVINSRNVISAILRIIIRGFKDNPDYQKWLDSNGELPFPNGETHEDFKNRCKDGFFESLTERDTAFVIHGGSIMAIMQKLFGGNFYDYQVKNGCGYEFEMRNGEIVDDYSPIGCG